MRYHNVAIEGCIGTGKTCLATMISERNHIRLLLERFKNNKHLKKFYEAKTKKEKLLHTYPMERFFLLDRVKQIKEHFAVKGEATVSDYFLKKCMAFAHVNLTGEILEKYTKLFDKLTLTLPVPDIVVYLERDTKELLELIKTKRNRKNESTITAEYLDALHENYLKQFKKLPDQRIVIINVTGMDFVNNEDDYKRILSVIDRDYPLGITYIENNYVKKLAA